MRKTALPQPTKRRLPPLAVVTPTGFRPVIGQAVQVTGGQLAGMRGVVIETGESPRCTVQLDGAAPGVLLSIDRKWLCKVPRRRS
jgi:transcription elongation factor